jgi:uncharacterized protein
MHKRPPSSQEASASRPDAPRPAPAARVLLLLLRGYRRVVAPLFPPACRFFPSCSAFAMEAVEQRGAARGVLLTVGRLARCHPWNSGGHDPVPLEKA